MANLKVNGNIEITGGGTLGGNNILTKQNIVQSENNWGVRYGDTIICWGYAENSNQRQSNFAIPFSNTNYAITANSIGTEKQDLYAVKIERQTSYAKFRGNYNAQNSPLTYIAIGE